MDHSDDQDTKLPPAAAQQQQQQLARQRRWDQAGASPAQYAPQQAPYEMPPQQQLPAQAGVAGYPVETDPYQRIQQLYQQQQQQQRAAYPPGYIPQQQQPNQQYATLQGGYFPAQPLQQAPGQQIQLHPGAHVAGGHFIQQALPPPHVQPQAQIPESFVAQPRIGRLPADRPVVKLSMSLIDTYKHINTVYYEERDARRAARAKEKVKQQQGVGGATNDGWDDENHDYIFTQGELFYGRYKIIERIGKGSFGQVVRAEDIQSHREVAIKIIKSKKPFLVQAKTEIELLSLLWEKDPNDQHNIVRLLTHFMYRNHQCLVFEMLSLNLYELLKNTQFGGVSLNLIKKFARQVLKALAFLSKSDVDIIHCDLKPENILLRHPKKSGVKVIDFGSSCRSNKRMYSYIQSRFYRSPEVILGLPYTVAIDMWSLGCILAEMHTGEPLFSGSDQFDQMQKIVQLLGIIPSVMLDKSKDETRSQFFERTKTVTGVDEWKVRQTKPPSASADAAATAEDTPSEPIVPSTDPIASLSAVITAGNRQKKKFPLAETYNSRRNYELFVDLVSKMLTYLPEQRIKPNEALRHPFLAELSSASPVGR